MKDLGRYTRYVFLNPILFTTFNIEFIVLAYMALTCSVTASQKHFVEGFNLRIFARNWNSEFTP